MDNTPQSLTCLSFCTGIRGLERGVELVTGRLDLLAYVENEAFIIANLVAGMETGFLDPVPVWTDIKTFNAKPFRGKVDLLLGGYPCQPFSTAGKRKGTEDPRHLYPFIERSIDIIRPGGSSLKTSQDTLPSDTRMSKQAWKKWVTSLRKEYTQRRKSVHHTGENGYSYLHWPTATASRGQYQNVNRDIQGKARSIALKLEGAVKQWATPVASPNANRTQKPAPSHLNRKHGQALSAQVKQWPTPRGAEWKDCGEQGSKSQQYRLNKKYLDATVKEYTGPQDRETFSTTGKSRAQLNPAWVAQLMGTTLEKTFFVPLGTLW